jgi:hypothetical protein
MQSMVLMLDVQKQYREHINHLPGAVNGLRVRCSVREKAPAAEQGRH